MVTPVPKTSLTKFQETKLAFEVITANSELISTIINTDNRLEEQERAPGADPVPRYTDIEQTYLCAGFHKVKSFVEAQ